MVFDETINYYEKSLDIDKFLEYYFGTEGIVGKNVLDAGCHIGDYIFEFVKKGANHAVGIDLSEQCIDVAQSKKENDRCSFFQGDIRNLCQFKDSTFDIITCVGTIIYLPPEEMQLALSEFNRVIKPGGIILVLFQKEKNLIFTKGTSVINILPFKMYLFWVHYFGFMIIPLMNYITKRKINLKMARKH